VSVESLDPDIRVNYTIADYLALRDPALDRAIETLESSGSAATAQRTVIP
jgi:hypothetical protein